MCLNWQMQHASTLKAQEVGILNLDGQCKFPPLPGFGGRGMLMFHSTVRRATSETMPVEA